MNNNYSYAQLNSRLEKRQNVKIETNTYAMRYDNLVISQDKSTSPTSIIITLHNNEIAELTPDKIRLTSSGWMTSTTKDRLNKILPDNYRIVQDHQQWYLYDNRVYSYVGIFRDGLSFEPCNHPGQWVVIGNTMGQDNTILRKSILKYCKGYIQSLKRGEIEEPSPKDCLYCQLFLGEGVESTDHLISHMDDLYYVPSLLYNAIRWYPVSRYAQDGIRALMYSEVTQDDCDTFAWIIDHQVYGSLKRYMFRQFGLPT